MSLGVIEKMFLWPTWWYFYMVVGDLNSGPYICMTSTLPTKPSPQTLQLLSLLYNVIDTDSDTIHLNTSCMGP